VSKQKVQDWVFPQGMRYNKENDTVRTNNFNMEFLWMACQQQTLSKIKSGIPILNIGYSAWVGFNGLNPNEILEELKKLCSFII
jgi:hypothetical protein